MASCRSILFELSLAFPCIRFGLICFVIKKLPAGMFACFVFLDPGFEVAAVSVIQLTASRLNQHLNVEHGLFSQVLSNLKSSTEKCWALTPCRHTVSGSVSLRSQRFFSPFPHGTGSLSVANEYLALRRGRRGFMRSFTCSALLRNSPGPLWISVTGVSPSMPELSISLTYPRRSHYGVLQPRRQASGLGCCAFARHY
jgi:hypothetical protein